MGRAKEHDFITILIIIALVYVISLFPIKDFWSYGGWIIFGAVLPDILEPAIHYTHRKKFHSQEAYKYSAICFIISLLLGMLMKNYWLLSISFLLLGYVSHLFLDSFSQRGLFKGK